MISEETLTLYYYEDGLGERDRLEIEKALRTDDVLAARYSELCRQLDDWRDVPEIAAPSHTVQRWHDTIDRAAMLERQNAGQPRQVNFMSFFLGAAITAALAIGIGIGFWFATPDPAAVVPDSSMAGRPPATDRAVPASFTRGLELHLQESQWEIASLPVDNDADRALLAMQLIEQNRLFQRSATVNNSPELARVLRAFEPVLIRLASDELSPEEAIALREKLAFEMSVMLTKISRGTSKEAETI